MKQSRYISAAIVALFLVFTLSVPANHTEAEDAFDYALLVQESDSQSLFHARHLLYAPFASLVFQTARGLGIASKSYPVLIFLSITSAVLALCMFYLILRNRLGLSSALSLLSTSFLFASYGFWRYSVEAEVYAPAALFVTLLLYYSLAPRPTLISSLLVGVIASIGVLFHLINLLPAFVAAWILFIRSRKISFTIVYSAAIAGIVVSTYAIVVDRFAISDALFSGEGVRPFYEGVGISTLGKAFVGFAQNLFSGNFLFAHEMFRSSLTALFPYRMLDEEIFMGVHAPPGSASVPFATLSGIIVVAAFLLYRFIKSRGDTSHEDGMIRKILYVYLGLYFVTISLFEPGNPEAWVLSLVPFWILVTVWLFKQLPLRILAVLLAVTVSHNIFGGYLLIRAPEGDYNFQKSRWLVENTEPVDRIITLDNEVFSRFLRYHAKAPVTNLLSATTADLQQTESTVEAAEGKIYSTADVVRPPDYIKHLLPDFYDRYQLWLRSARLDFVRMDDDVFGGIYLVRPNPSPARAMDPGAVINRKHQPGAEVDLSM